MKYVHKRIRNIKKEVLSDNWYVLNKYTFEYLKDDGSWEKQQREAYDRGNGAAILLYNKALNSVILTRQFRIPTYVNGNPDGMMIEVCAGLLDGDHPEDCIKKEVAEETGYEISEVTKVFEAYMSPGSVTEILHFFVGAYEDRLKTGQGGGAAHETENIEVLEYTFPDALRLLEDGHIRDAKTVMLLQYAELKGLLRNEVRGAGQGKK